MKEPVAQAERTVALAGETEKVSQAKIYGPLAALGLGDRKLIVGYRTEWEMILFMT
jgi:hypothetical protein